MAAKQEDHWDSAAYQNAASFVPKLATKVLEWLDVRENDEILDIGCGDGVLDLQISPTFFKGTGFIHGIDSSESMIATANKSVSAYENSRMSHVCTFEVLDATQLITSPARQTSSFDKVFSNAAMHWILRPETHRKAFFQGVRNALKPGGIFVFEMGGLGNVAEMRAALISVVAKRVGIERAREVDPWFFPDERWMRGMLEETVGGWKVERMEMEYRPTEADQGGVRAWVKLMGK
ncbi:putative methyltransferase, partial [Lachnellula subtilissima]